MRMTLQLATARHIDPFCIHTNSHSRTSTTSTTATPWPGGQASRRGRRRGGGPGLVLWEERLRSRQAVHTTRDPPRCRAVPRPYALCVYVHITACPSLRAPSHPLASLHPSTGRGAPVLRPRLTRVSWVLSPPTCTHVPLYYPTTAPRPHAFLQNGRGHRPPQPQREQQHQQSSHTRE